ncbi:hypothetical protein [Serratia grimesii]|uniref:hypothetical protein n=1 Tax=Serratia grimesii TaxID=82995 RepID=UPI00077C9B2E|nr:hypothetical protein [Serratia grimesii]CAI0725513.1 Uncharacterised protein [Serratia grimesii]CAI2444216.1 Uncharacterised protein [Serratia grimesii]SUI32698.1 Uncharacterised protein [Serratia grimesii]
MVESKQIADLLNKLFTLDATAAEALVNHRVECNEAFLASDIPFVCSRSGNGVISIGIVGFLNAMASPDSGRVAANYSDEKQLVGFTVVGCKECEPYQYEDYLS